MTSARAAVLGLAAAAALASQAGASGAATSVRHDADQAREILLAREARYRLESEEYLGEIVVTARNGRERRRIWRSYRQGNGATTERLIRVLAPPDVRGVGYLLRQRPGRAPDEWLYLPSMKRERRIAGSDREAALAGTDFSYEDFEEFDPGRYDATTLADRTIEGRLCHVLRVVPKHFSTYAFKVIVLRKDNLAVEAIEYYGRRDRRLAKQLTALEYRDFDGHPIPTRIEMHSISRGSRTVLLLRDVAVNRPQPADRFTIQNLVREDEPQRAPERARR